MPCLVQRRDRIFVKGYGFLSFAKNTGKNLGINIEMALINCEINLILTWSANCVVSNAAANQDTTFAITDTNLYVQVVTLSTQDNAKPFQ